MHNNRKPKQCITYASTSKSKARICVHCRSNQRNTKKFCFQRMGGNRGLLCACFQEKTVYVYSYRRNWGLCFALSSQWVTLLKEKGEAKNQIFVHSKM